MKRIAIVGGTVAVLTLIVLLAAGILLNDPPSPTPQPTPEPELRAEATDLRTFPETSAEVRDEVTESLEAFLEDVYSRAFLPPLPPPSPDPNGASSPAPTPVPRPPLGELLTEGTRDALGASPEAFRPDDSASVFRGVIRFEGIVSMVDDSPRDALLQITFEGKGRIGSPTEEPEDSDATPEIRYRDLRLTQEGTLRLVRLQVGWRISHIDVEILDEVEVPSIPSPAALQHSSPRGA